MSWDLQIDSRTGDLVWNSIHDLSAAMGEALVKQRIQTRLRVIRGSFRYDDSGTLGSRLTSLLRLGIPNATPNIASIVHEALAPMTDITVTDVQIFTFDDGSGVVDDPSIIIASISYQMVYASNEQLSPDIPSQLQTQVAIPA